MLSPTQSAGSIGILGGGFCRSDFMRGVADGLVELFSTFSLPGATVETVKCADRTGKGEKALSNFVFVSLVLQPEYSRSLSGK